MDDLAAKRVTLLLLDHDRDRLRPVDLEVEQGVALEEQVAKLALGDLERAGLAALAVDDAGDKPLATQAAAGARAEAVAGVDVECGSVCGHGFFCQMTTEAVTLGTWIAARIENVT